jgi:AcrR family transcriptional regulator
MAKARFDAGAQPVAEASAGSENFRTRTGQARREKMLARLLAATMEVCGATDRRGAAVIDDVIKVAGVSRGAFYWYFDTIEEAIEKLGQRLADEIGEETRAIFGSEASPLKRAALGGQVVMTRGLMDRVWAGFLSNVHIFEDDSIFMIGVRHNLKVGRSEKLFSFDSLPVAVDFQIGATLAVVRRFLSDGPHPRESLVQMNTLILRGLGVDEKTARAVAQGAADTVDALGPKTLSWWRDDL